MAEKKKSDQVPTGEEQGPEGAAPAVSDADDGGQSRFHKAYKPNPDVPDESSIAQVQELDEKALERV